MSALQNKVLSEIAKIAAKAKVDPDTEMNWANTGRINFRLGFKTVANMTFDFQDTYFTVLFAKGEKSPRDYGNHARSFYVNANSESEIMACLNYIKSALKGAK